MGGVRTKTVKRAARNIIEKYYPLLTLDFHTNKRVVDEVAVIETKRLRNKIAGFITHLMRRIQKGPVRGISFKLQEEERDLTAQMKDLIARKMVRCAGIRNNMNITDAQAQGIVDSLFACEEPGTAVGGGKCMTIMTLEELAKKLL